MIDSAAQARYYEPIGAEPVSISARFLSEDERVQIGDLLVQTGDLLRVGHSVR